MSFWLIFILFLTGGYAAHAQSSVSKETDCIELDMSVSQSFNFDTWVEEILCTPLEGIYFNNSIQVLPHNDYLYIAGRTILGNTVVVYRKDGSFVKQITLSDALLVNAMSYQPKRDELWVISRFKIINRFKPDGTPIKQMSLPFPCSDLHPVGDESYLIYSGGKAQAIEGHYWVLTDFHSIQQLFIPKRDIGNKNLTLFQRPIAPTHPGGNNLYLFTSNTDTIYLYNKLKKTLTPRYHLNFQGELLTENQIPYGKNEDAEMSRIIQEKRWINGHNSFCYIAGKLVFKLRGKRNDFCFIDLKTNKCYSTPHLFNQFLPNTMFHAIAGSDGEQLYVLVRGKELFTHYLHIKCTYPAIQRLLPSLTADTNNWYLLTIKMKKG